ncbi:MAG: hypothetical protein J6D21_09370 [Clostridia bacterium]|nr:hypothetical protein [Clostridia bacterium]
MKRSLKIISVFFSILFTFATIIPVFGSEIYSIVYEREGHTITTPNGTAVAVWVALNDYSEEEKLSTRVETEERFPGIEFLGEVTGRYNCHSYAWYQRSTSNPYWLDSIDAFLADPNYMETTTPAVGDIIVYYTPANNVNHSGVIDEVLSGTSNGVCGDANLYMVVSKWGKRALYRHRGDYCDYVREHGGSSSYVKYYHMHLYTYTDRTVYVHTVNCSCMDPITEPHTWVQIGIESLFRCTVCGYRSTFTPANPENVSAEIWMQLMTRATMEDGATFTLGNMTFCYMDGQYYIVTECAPDVVIPPNVME